MPTWALVLLVFDAGWTAGLALVAFIQRQQLNQLEELLRRLHEIRSRQLQDNGGPSA